MSTPPSHDGSTTAELRASHTPDAIRSRLASPPESSYLRDFVYGAIDGAVTTFAVVSGVAGAGLDDVIVVILGVANLVGDGFSMAAGNYLGTRAEQQQRDRMRDMEARHIDAVPEGEREEIRQIFAAQGFVGESLERVVNVITADRTRWIDTMLKEEHGLPLRGPAPLRAALVTFLAFLIVGSIPLAPFVPGLAFQWQVPAPYLLSTLFTGAAFFAIGAAKSLFVQETWHAAGLETLLVGGVAAALAYACGLILGNLT
jgi:VIT1/CCC1 family predicted Fe2+/Mn2+ transporter